MRAKVLETWALPEGIVGAVEIKIHTDPQTITVRPNNTLAWTFSESIVNRVLLSAVLACVSSGPHSPPSCSPKQLSI